MLTLLEVLAEANLYLDSLRRADDAESELEALTERPGCTRDVLDGCEVYAVRTRDLARAVGYSLRTKAEGWGLFCERMGARPLQAWEGLPGYDRLRRALDLAALDSHSPEGFLDWMNAMRPEGEPEHTRVPLTAEGLADTAEAMFRENVEWWGG